MPGWWTLSLRDQLAAIDSGELDPAELLEVYLGRIQAQNPSIHAFTHVAPEQARTALGDALAKRSAADAPLAGLPSADKDLVQRRGMPTGYGSLTTTGAPVASESDPMALWMDREGIVSVGKTATSEFGMSAATEARNAPATLNPHDLSRSAGGSSGGAAAAVAQGLLPFAPGSDGGGSIRIPALACGVVGWKPSRGLVPAGSGFEFLGGLAVPGLIARHVADIALVAERLVTGSWDWSVRAPGHHGEYRQALDVDVRGWRVGWTTATPWPADWGIAPDQVVIDAMQRALDALVEAGCEVTEIDWQPDNDYAEHFVTVWAASAAMIPLPPEAREQVEPLTRHLIEQGEALTAPELARALGWQRRFERDTIESFAPYDAIVTPGLGMTAPKIGWFDQVDPVTNFRQQVQFTPWTSFVNVAGLPAIALPTLVGSTGLPMGAQLIGRPGADATVMALAQQIQSRCADALVWPAGAV